MEQERNRGLRCRSSQWPPIGAHGAPTHWLACRVPSETCPTEWQPACSPASTRSTAWTRGCQPPSPGGLSAKLRVITTTSACARRRVSHRDRLEFDRKSLFRGCRNTNRVKSREHPKSDAFLRSEALLWSWNQASRVNSCLLCDDYRAPAPDDNRVMQRERPEVDRTEPARCHAR
jgi:hypothetical protein